MAVCVCFFRCWLCLGSGFYDTRCVQRVKFLVELRSSSLGENLYFPRELAGSSSGNSCVSSEKTLDFAKPDLCVPSPPAAKVRVKYRGNSSS